MAATRLPASPFPSMWSPPPPVNTPQNSASGSGGSDKKGSSSSATKPIENPLLTRSPPRFTAATTGNRTPSLTTPPHFMLTNGSPPPNNNNLTLTTTTTTTTMVTGREPLNTVLGNGNDGGSGLRQRKGVLKGVATNTSVALNGFTPPPRATLSLQGHMLRNVCECVFTSLLIWGHLFRYSHLIRLFVISNFSLFYCLDSIGWCGESSSECQVPEVH